LKKCLFLKESSMKPPSPSLYVPSKILHVKEKKGKTKVKVKNLLSERGKTKLCCSVHPKLKEDLYGGWIAHREGGH